jgi:hypothetical protein
MAVYAVVSLKMAVFIGFPAGGSAEVLFPQ